MSLPKMLAATHRSRNIRLITAVLATTIVAGAATGCSSNEDSFDKHRLSDESISMPIHTSPTQKDQESPSPKPTNLEEKMQTEYVKVLFKDKITNAYKDNQVPVLQPIPTEEFEEQGLKPLKILRNVEYGGKVYAIAIVMHKDNYLLQRVGYKAVKSMLQERDKKKQSFASITVKCGQDALSTQVTAKELKNYANTKNKITINKKDQTVNFVLPMNKDSLTHGGEDELISYENSRLLMTDEDFTPNCLDPHFER